MRTDCIAIYTLETLTAMFDTAYANYTSVDDGYDALYEYYVTYITKLIPLVIDQQFMFDDNQTTETMDIAFPGPGMSCMWIAAKVFCCGAH